MTTRRTLTAASLVAAAVFLGAALLAGTVDPPAEGTIDFELRKYLIQFLLLVALGAVVALILENAKQRASDEDERRRKDREASERERQTAIDIVTLLLDRLGTIYREVKRRRHAWRLVPEATFTKARYVEATLELHADKQALEVLWQDIRTNARWLPELDSIWPGVEKMEDYLRPIEDEVERARETPDSEFMIASQEVFIGFLAKARAGESTFGTFRALHHEARAGLVDVLADKRRRSDSPPSVRSDETELDS